MQNLLVNDKKYVNFRIILNEIFNETLLLSFQTNQGPTVFLDCFIEKRNQNKNVVKGHHLETDLNIITPRSTNVRLTYQPVCFSSV